MMTFHESKLSAADVDVSPQKKSNYSHRKIKSSIPSNQITKQAVEFREER